MSQHADFLVFLPSKYGIEHETRRISHERVSIMYGGHRSRSEVECQKWNSQEVVLMSKKQSKVEEGRQ